MQPDPATAADRVAILEMLALYGHIIDLEEWDKLSRVFTADCVFETCVQGEPIFRGITELRDGFLSLERPIAHLTTNCVVLSVAADRATTVSKWYTISRDPQANRTGDYLDTLARTDEGWRIERRVARWLRAAPAA